MDALTQDQKNIIEINKSLENAYKDLSRIEKTIFNRKEQNLPYDNLETEATQTKQFLTTLFIARAQRDVKMSREAGTTKISDLNQDVADQEKVKNLADKKHKKLSEILSDPLGALKEASSNFLGDVLGTEGSKDRADEKAQNLEEDLAVAKIKGDEKKTLKIQGKIKEQEDVIVKKSMKGSILSTAKNKVKSSALMFTGSTLDKVTDALEQDTKAQKYLLDKSVNMLKYVTVTNNTYNIQDIKARDEAKNMVQHNTIALMKTHNTIRKKYGYSPMKKEDFISSLSNQYVQQAFSEDSDYTAAKGNDKKELEKTKEARDSKDARDSVDTKNARDSKDARGSVDTKNARDGKDGIDARDVEPKPSPKGKKEQAEQSRERFGMIGALGASLGIKNSLNDNDYDVKDSKKMVKLSESISENLEKIAVQMVDEQDTTINRKGKKEKQKFDKNGKAVKEDKDTSLWDMAMAGLGMLGTWIWKKIGPMVKKLFGKLLAPFKKTFEAFKKLAMKGLRFAKGMINRLGQKVFGKNLFNMDVDTPEGKGKNSKGQTSKGKGKNNRSRKRKQKRSRKSKGRGLMSGCACMPDSTDRKNKKTRAEQKVEKKKATKMKAESVNATKATNATKGLTKGTFKAPRAKPRMAKGGFLKTLGKGAKGLGKSVFKVGGAVTAGALTAALLGMDAMEIRNAMKDIFGASYEKRVSVIAKSVAALGTSQVSWLWGSSPEEDFVKYIVTTESLTLEEFDKAMAYIEGDNDEFLKIIMLRKKNLGASDPAVLEYGEEAMKIFGTAGTKLVKKNGKIKKVQQTMSFTNKKDKKILDFVKKTAKGSTIWEAMDDASIISEDWDAGKNDVTFKALRLKEYVNTYLDDQQVTVLIKEIQQKIDTEEIVASDGKKMITVITGEVLRQKNLQVENTKMKKSDSIMKKIHASKPSAKEYQALSKDLSEKDRKKYIQERFVKYGADDAVVKSEGDYTDKAVHSKQVLLEDGTTAVYSKILATSKKKMDNLTGLANKNMEEFLLGLENEKIIVRSSSGFWALQPMVIKDLIETRSIPLEQWGKLASYIQKITRKLDIKDGLSLLIKNLLNKRKVQKDNVQSFTTFDNENGAKVMSNYSGRVDYTPKKVSYKDTGEVRDIDDMSLKELFINNGNNNIEGLDENVLHNLKGMAAEFKEMTGRKMQVNSAFRSFEEQADMKKRHGKKAATPGYSMHNYGLAFDIQTKDANEAISANLFKKYGFWRPIVASETWHIEPLGIDRKRIRDNGVKKYRATGQAPSPVSGGVSIDSEGSTITKKYGAVFARDETKPVEYSTGEDANAAYDKILAESGIKATVIAKAKVYPKKKDADVQALKQENAEIKNTISKNEINNTVGTAPKENDGANHSTSIRDKKLEGTA